MVTAQKQQMTVCAAMQDREVSWACLLDPKCIGATGMFENGLSLWCPACMEAQPQTKEQATKHHTNNPIAYGLILPFQPLP